MKNGWIKRILIGQGMLRASRDEYSPEGKRWNLALSENLVGMSILRFLQSPFPPLQGISVLSLPRSNGTGLSSCWTEVVGDLTALPVMPYP